MQFDSGVSRERPRSGLAHVAGVLICGLVSGIASARLEAQLFENLEAFGERLDAGSPKITSTWKGGREGPKDLDAGDLDGDGIADLAASNLDGTITLLINRGDGELAQTRHLEPGVSTLRSLRVVDLSGDGRPEIIAAAPIEGELVVYTNRGGGAFEGPARIETWSHARDLSVGDFDGNGTQDLVVGGGAEGLRHWSGRGDGTFRRTSQISVLGGWDQTRPVFSLESIAAGESGGDVLLASHAWSDDIFVFSAGDKGELVQDGSVRVSCGVWSMAIGAVTGPRSSDLVDLVTAHRDCGIVQVRRGVAQASRFASELHQEIELPGQPRSLELCDLDGDGWNDLAVVLRGVDRVVTLRNDGGLFVLSTESPVGRSPRAVAAADFNLDGSIDLAVANRVSGDIDLLTGYPGEAGFGALDQFYLVDGEVADLRLVDVDGDRLDDVVQLHRASGDVSVRLATEGGALGSPRHFTVGDLPTDQRFQDVNGDSIPDLLSANLGSERGSLSVLIADGEGGFESERIFEVPGDVGGRLFALDAADFDGDGDIDVAAGFFDCRLAFYRNEGDLDFVLTQEQAFLYEARAMAVGDFDGDGDIDVAGGSASGLVAILENEGNIMDAQEWPRTEYEPTAGRFGASEMVARDMNGDGDLDLLVTGGNGVQIFYGSDGVGFDPQPGVLPGTAFPASSIATGDFDGDGREDVAVSCHLLSCVTVLTRDDEDRLRPALQVEVPAGRFVACGDIDGDGFDDLVGSGESLWTALSGRRAGQAPPPVHEPERRILAHPVFNEVLAINNALVIEEDEGKKPDWVELFNGSEEPASVGGWEIELYSRDESDAEHSIGVYRFPEGALIAEQGFLQVTFSGNARSEYHTGFKLPGAGARLVLRDGDGTEIDRVVFPEQRDNVSYARYRDGLERSWGFNQFPSRLASNSETGPVLPVASFDLALGAGAPMHSVGDLAIPAAGEPIRFYATGNDDVGIVTLSLLWERRDLVGQSGRTILYDDGMHDDGERLDGNFAGDLEEGLPAGAEIRFRMEVVDLSDHVVLLPDGSATENGATETGYYSLAVGSSMPALRIAEIVARNDSGLRDENGGTPDWVEVTNCSDDTVSLDGVFLGTRFPGTEDWFRWPEGSSLEAGERAIVFCDGNRQEGNLHAAFTLRRAGGRLFLGRTAESGASSLIDAVEYPALESDRAFARTGCSRNWVLADPTPGELNETTVLNGDVDLSGELDLTDAVAILDFLFRGDSLACRAAADVNDSGRADLSDAVWLLQGLFAAGPGPMPERVTCE